MFLVKSDYIDELMQISRQICIFTYLQSLVQYDIDNHIVTTGNYHLPQPEVLYFITDKQENCAAELRNILYRNDFIQPVQQ